MLGLFDFTPALKLTKVKRKYLERSVALVNVARKAREKLPAADDSKMREWRLALAEVDKFIDLAMAPKERPPVSEEDVTKQFRIAAKAILDRYDIPKSQSPKEEEEIKILQGGRHGDKDAEKIIQTHEDVIKKWLTEFTKEEVKLQVASVKSPILHLQGTDEGKSTKGPFGVSNVKISKLASVDWLLLQLHIKAHTPYTANSHAYSKNIGRHLWFANDTTAKSVGLADTVGNLIKGSMQDKMLTIIPERRWVLVVVPLSAHGRRTFGNFWDTENKRGDLYVTQGVFGDVAVYDPPHDAKLQGFLRVLVKNKLPVQKDMIESVRMVKVYEERPNEWKMQFLSSEEQDLPPDSNPTTRRGESPSVRTMVSTTSTVVESLHSSPTIVNTPLPSATREPAVSSRRAEPPSVLPAAPVTTPSGQYTSPDPPAPAPSPAKGGPGFIRRWFGGGGGSSAPAPPVNSGMQGTALTDFAVLGKKKGKR